VTESRPVVAIEDLVVRYRTGFSLGPLALSLDGGVTCVVGVNGAGKSTLLRVLVGAQRASGGCLTFSQDGVVGYLSQDPQLPRFATCEALLTHVAWLHKVPRSSRNRAVASSLDMVGLADLKERRIGTLSGGQQRRLAIAQALVHRPSLVVLDEPTAGLDPLQRVEIRSLISRLAATTAFVVSTHLVEDVRGVATRVVVLADGRIVFDGTTTGLEGLARDEAPGDTVLERALSHILQSSAAHD
jgi:ABC-2 type transport system ATP-binding protein